MPENKDQHFVPKFYLRNFSSDGGARTNLIVADDLTSRCDVGIRGQCQQGYFYGKDLTFEHALGTIETSAANVIHNIIRTGTLPRLGSGEDVVLKTHICVQWTRTRGFNESTDLALSKMLKAAYRERFKSAGLTDDQIDDVEIGRVEGPRESVAQGMDYMPFFWDLDSKLIFANQLGEFVTSDDPVVLINPFYFGRFPGGTSGVALEGTMILFPVSAEYLVILFDRRVYRVGALGKNVVPLGSVSDLIALNNYTFLNAHKCLYHRECNLGIRHISEFERVKGLRRPNRQQLREVLMQNGSTLLHSFEEPINYRPPTSFMKILRRRRGETADVDRIPPRDPDLSAHFDAYSKIRSKEKQGGGFLAYVANLANGMLSEREKAGLNEEIAKRGQNPEGR